MLFHTLISSLILYRNLLSLDALNKVLSILLHKGHSKDPYISNCTVLAKGLDAYVGSLYTPLWDKSQIDVQYQGKNSSHDLASLQVTELTQLSNNVHNRPL